MNFMKKGIFTIWVGLRGLRISILSRKSDFPAQLLQGPPPSGVENRSFGRKGFLPLTFIYSIINSMTVHCETGARSSHSILDALFSSDEAHFWLNGYVNKQNCRIWIEANPQVYVETPLHPEKLTVWCALWAGGILLQKR
ncbi:hypothetical protein TNCV_3990081 [Trichonephila clavipes]|uniref:Uncharacterized protein n=1 Tax=Trichonephila clavipes TaxID=2585209 RepID=A0A8X6VSJ8_TRICX|nr:hypothetical protein TNCV_3990081 [Trichonephila clavipes]